MTAVRVEIVRFVDAHQPGVVECRLRDAWGREWVFHEKVPVVTDAPLDEGSSYPLPGEIACVVVREWRDAQGRDLRTIDTSRPWHVTALGGESSFDVLSNELRGE